MESLLQKRLKKLAEQPELMRLIKRGVEREALRVDYSGKLAFSSHPKILGSSLTHPFITTDYAEGLLEFITPPVSSGPQVVEQLDAIFRKTYMRLGDELLWSLSMPCELPSDFEISIANYGTSHIGQLKHIYRRGLALRYGKRMQCIAGVHYNYSLASEVWEQLRHTEASTQSAQDFQSESYLALVRNFRRIGWLLMYLFGATPALSKNFLGAREHGLDVLSEDTYYLPFSTSLRMSDLGYQNDSQAEVILNENNFESYIHSLNEAIMRPYAPYVAWGVKQAGEWIQLSTNLLQIENEYYSTIRPKRTTQSGERMIHGLKTRGVEYIEVRCMDIDPFEPLGIDVSTMCFLDVFLLTCALSDSPLCSVHTQHVQRENFAKVVKLGRKPGLQLQRDGRLVSLRDWGLELLETMYGVAHYLDSALGHDDHVKSLREQFEKLRDPEQAPSARVLASLEAHGNSLQAFGLEQSLQFAKAFKSSPPSVDEMREFDRIALNSLDAQHKLEESSHGSFDEYVCKYYADLLCLKV